MFELVNIAPFGQGMRGHTRVLIQKDRSGDLRQHGEPVGGSRATYFADLVLDGRAGELAITLGPPHSADAETATQKGVELAEDTLQSSRLDLIGVLADVFPTQGATKAEARRHMVKPRWVHSVKTFDRSWDDLVGRGVLARIKGGQKYRLVPVEERLSAALGDEPFVGPGDM
jgi:hypothetical protein